MNLQGAFAPGRDFFCLNFLEVMTVATAQTKPSTLMALAQEHELARHRSRLQALKAMEAKLRALDAFMPAIRAAGITISGDELNCWTFGRLYIQQPILNRKRNAELERVLRAQGMREVEVRPGAQGYDVELKKGHLTVCMYVEKVA